MVDKNQREQAVQQLEEAKGSDPEYASYYKVYQKIFSRQDETKKGITGELEMADRQALEGRARQGLPQLTFSQLPIESDLFHKLAQDIADIMLEYRGQEEKNDEEIIHKEIDWFSLAEERFEKHEKTETEFLSLVVDLALMPYLEWASERIMPHLSEKYQGKSKCPVCGGEPNFSFLEKENGARWLICSRCRTEWRYTRLVCPFCENKEPANLKYYPAGENQTYRLYVCEVCLRYLKAIDLRKTRGDIGFLAETILTWSLDLAAREKGYR